MRLTPVLTSLALLSNPAAASRRNEDRDPRLQYPRDELRRKARPCPTPAGPDLARRTPNSLRKGYDAVGQDTYGQGNEYNQGASDSQNLYYGQSNMYGQKNEDDQGNVYGQDKVYDQGSTNQNAQKGANGFSTCDDLPSQQQRQCRQQQQELNNQHQNQIPSPVQQLGGPGQQPNAIQNNDIQAPSPAPTSGPPISVYAGWTYIVGLTCAVTSTSQGLDKIKPFCSCNNSEQRELFTGSNPWSNTPCPPTFHFDVGEKTLAELSEYQLTQTNEGGTTWKCQFSTVVPDESTPRCLGTTSTIFAPTPIITVIPATGGAVYIGNMSSSALSAGLSNMLATSCTISGTRGANSVLECPATMTMPGVFYPKKQDPRLYPSHLVAIQQQAGTYFPNPDVLNTLAEIWGAMANSTVFTQADKLCSQRKMSYNNFEGGGGSFQAQAWQHVNLPDFPECSMPAEWLITYLSGRQENKGVDAMMWLKLTFQADGDKSAAKWDQAMCEASGAMDVLSWVACMFIPPTCGVLKGIDSILSVACEVGAAAVRIEAGENAPATKV